uniref:Uncharacterized protein n=1 Tax=Thermofilum adornatum TaxID=1365176 RepID=A0A7C1GBT5_9CREN
MSREPLRRVSYTERKSKKAGHSGVVQVCHFYPYTYSKKPEVSAVCPWSELVLFAESLGARLSGKRSLRVDDGVYKRLLVYGVVRERIRDPSKAGELREIVAGLDEYELHFWFAKFIAATERGRRALNRPARAFRVLYGLD